MMTESLFLDALNAVVGIAVLILSLVQHSATLLFQVLSSGTFKKLLSYVGYLKSLNWSPTLFYDCTMILLVPLVLLAGVKLLVKSKVHEPTEDKNGIISPEQTDDDFDFTTARTQSHWKPKGRSFQNETEIETRIRRNKQACARAKAAAIARAWEFERSMAKRSVPKPPRSPAPRQKIVEQSEENETAAQNLRSLAAVLESHALDLQRCSNDPHQQPSMKSTKTKTRAAIAKILHDLEMMAD